jgi:hypothetical protein
MENMNKKLSASTEASPRPSVTTRCNKRSLVDELLASVRDNGALVTLICSYLPIKDRVKLGEVDKQFLADEYRGQIVGVYGAGCLDTEAALEEVRRYVKYESTRSALSNFYFQIAPDCWKWIVGSGLSKSELGGGETSGQLVRREIWMGPKCYSRARGF